MGGWWADQLDSKMSAVTQSSWSRQSAANRLTGYQLTGTDWSPVLPAGLHGLTRLCRTSRTCWAARIWTPFPGLSASARIQHRDSPRAGQPQKSRLIRWPPGATPPEGAGAAAARDPTETGGLRT